ncbi:type IV toxin-antitoxin system AbiEi family antitoxin domain-containing protein [Micromonospora sp. NPDC004551]|uniref:type IV toxin-antitoxin system AbiEi family antitoxin domain-containing protein n=1 Tax=Micromonospora sp. NPDC004551 TaxID=3154284 RepID=UPI0033AA616E
MADRVSLGRVAARQGGVVTAAQAVSLGFSRDQVRHLARSGRWIRVARGCFVPAPQVDVAALRRARTARHRRPGLARRADHRRGRRSGPHQTPHAVYENRVRQNRLANAGWTVLRFTWPDTLRPDYIPHTIACALPRPR